MTFWIQKLGQRSYIGAWAWRGLYIGVDGRTWMHVFRRILWLIPVRLFRKYMLGHKSWMERKMIEWAQQENTK